MSWSLRLLLGFIGISGVFCVLFGAWLAHAGSHLSPELMNRLSTAHSYQIFHTVTLLAIVVWIQTCSSKWLYMSAWLFVLGICLFSMSLYFKTLFAVSFIGKFAPIGGISLALAWLNLVLAAIFMHAEKGKN